MSDTNGRNGVADITRSHMPLLKAIAFGGFLVWATWMVRGKLSDIDKQMTALNNRIGALQTQITSSTDSRWRRLDQERFCREAERHPPNKALGWECPELPEPASN